MFDGISLPSANIPQKKDKNGIFVQDILEKQGFRFWAETVTKKGPKTSSGYAGVTVISKIPFSCAEEGVGDYELDKEGRFLTLDVEGFYLAVSYFPNAGKKGALPQMDKRISFNNQVRKKVWSFDKPFLLER